MPKSRIFGLRLAAPQEDAAPEPDADTTVSSGGEDAVDPRVMDFAREHRSELFTSEAEVPTRFRDLLPLNGPITAHTYFVPSFLSGDSFGDDTPASHNYRSFMQLYQDAPGIYPVVGPHNSYAVAIRLNVINEDMLLHFEGVQDGDEDQKKPGGIDDTAVDEAWKDWAHTAFERALTARFPDFEQMIEGFSDSALHGLFEKMRRRTETDWTEDGGGHAFIDVEQIAQGAIPEDFSTQIETKEEEPEKKEASYRDIEHDQISSSTDEELARRRAEIEEIGKRNAFRGTSLYPPTLLSELQGIKSEQYARRKNITTRPHERYSGPEVDKVTKEASPEVQAEGIQDTEVRRIMNDPFIRGYFEAALFSSTDDKDRPLDANYGIADFAPETVQKMVADCEKFQAECGDLLTDENLTFRGRYDAQQRGGHDFWLTREHHGAGFWDGDWKPEAGAKLTEAARKFGPFELYVGDDGKIHS